MKWVWALLFIVVYAGGGVGSLEYFKVRRMIATFYADADRQGPRRESADGA
jgi:hypothetical protein